MKTLSALFRAHAARFVAPLLTAAMLPAAAIARPVTVADLLTNAPEADWREPDPDSTLYLQMAGGRVIIELAPRMAPLHVANIRALARAGYYDGLSIVRVQDNYVVQWGDPAQKRPIPAGVHLVAPEFATDRSVAAVFQRLDERDVYAPEVGFIDGFPAGHDPRTGLFWLAHCYGMVGVGRDDPPESDGTELYSVIGHAPRQLDRNVTLVGRVLMGIELLSSLPRGSGEMGFYAEGEAPVPLSSVRLASDVPPEQRTPIEVLRTASGTFHTLLDQRRNRRESWFKYNPGRIDLCNVPLPVRSSPRLSHTSR